MCLPDEADSQARPHERESPLAQQLAAARAEAENAHVLQTGRQQLVLRAAAHAQEAGPEMPAGPSATQTASVSSDSARLRLSDAGSSSDLQAEDTVRVLEGTKKGAVRTRVAEAAAQRARDAELE